jgi:hypothetical protein
VTADRHDFVVWLVEHHGKADTPLGDFARELDRCWEFPTSGDPAKLRESLEDIGVDEWVLDAFDVAWALYDPTCMYLGCTEPKMPGRLVCAEHAQGREDVR